MRNLQFSALAVLLCGSLLSAAPAHAERRIVIIQNSVPEGPSLEMSAPMVERARAAAAGETNDAGMPPGQGPRVTLPQISPAIMAGFLLAFTFSFDDFIIAFFVAGSETTLPIYIFSSIRRGVTPEINAISTVIICVSLALLFTSRSLQNRQTGTQESHHA